MKSTANATRAWHEMGEPNYLSAHQLEALQAASAIGAADQALRQNENSLELDVIVPPQGIAAITLSLLKDDTNAQSLAPTINEDFLDGLQRARL